jgi:hypothetical protein
MSTLGQALRGIESKKPREEEVPARAEQNPAWLYLPANVVLREIPPPRSASE